MRQKKKLITQLDQAQLRTFVDELPEGFDTVVGERGTKLSGGQKQTYFNCEDVLEELRQLLFLMKHQMFRC